MIRPLVALLLGLVLLGTTFPARAQSCRLPERLESRACATQGPARGKPGQFDYYVLSLSWSPAFCADSGRARTNRLQCADNSFSFIVHGLWPQYRDMAKGEPAWPQYCQRSEALPDAVLRRHLCQQPSSILMNCEWAKHGTCSGLDAPGYFAAIERLMGRLVLPDLERGEQQAGDLVKAMQAANAGLQREHIAVIVKDGALSEVRLCYNRNLTEYVACDSAVGGARPNRRLRVH
ncbi:ribonuclease T2 family protein [Ferrovibrio sp.]|uniref:ribonuclease T2 family protein n=1 Tax=Ferrovibrio sp. TaxID=1917215 RepID=UPI003D132B37